MFCNEALTFVSSLPASWTCLFPSSSIFLWPHHPFLSSFSECPYSASNSISHTHVHLFSFPSIPSMQLCKSRCLCSDSFILTVAFSSVCVWIYGRDQTRHYCHVPIWTRRWSLWHIRLYAMSFCINVSVGFPKVSHHKRFWIWVIVPDLHNGHSIFRIQSIILCNINNKKLKVIKQGLLWFKLHMSTSLHAVYAFDIEYILHVFFTTFYSGIIMSLIVKTNCRALQ